MLSRPMSAVTEAEAAMIRTAFAVGGEMLAAVEPPRVFPGITDMAKARACAGRGARLADPSRRSLNDKVRFESHGPGHVVEVG